MKRIAIDGRLILPHMSGIGRALIGLGGALAELDAADLAFELWVQRGLPADHPVRSLARPNLRLVELPAAHMSLRAQARLPLEALRRRPDLYHYPHFDLPWAVPGRVIVTIYDLKYLANPDFFPRQRQLRRLAVALLTRFACRRAARVLCPSAFTAGDLRARLGAPPAKLRVTPLGVAPRFFERLSPAELQDFRRRSGLEAPYLLCVGERRPHKNLPGLIEAYARLSAGRQNPPRLAIVGRPYAGYRAPEALVERLGLGERVRFIDYIADADLPALYQAAELFCLLSRYEGFGLPVLEAMASGAPVIAAECGALPEVAGGAARLTPPADPEQTAAALAGLLTGGAERESAIAGGLERARQFTWERCARLTIAAYREALAA